MHGEVINEECDLLHLKEWNLLTKQSCQIPEKRRVGYKLWCSSTAERFVHRKNIKFEQFDGLFDAFWLGKRVRSRSITSGAAKAANSPSLKNLQDSGTISGSLSATDQVPSAADAPEGRGGEGRMEGASRAENLAEELGCR